MDRGVYFPVYEKCKQMYSAPGISSLFHFPFCDLLDSAFCDEFFV